MRYYYTAYTKCRGFSKRYAGDGYIEAENAKEAKEMISFARGIPKSRVEVKKAPEPVPESYV